MFCMKCGVKLPDDAAFCYKCGKPVVLPDDAEAAKPAAPAARGCTPGKKYRCFGPEDDSLRTEAERRYHLEKSELYGEGGINGFYCWNYTVLDDGTFVGWVYMHIKKYRDAGAKDHYYNLYRVDPDGTATFLNAGSRSGIEDMFVLDGYAYWSGYGIDHPQGAYRVNIYDGSAAEKLTEDQWPK